jgi:hypothetical protein
VRSGEDRSPDLWTWGVRPLVRTPGGAWCRRPFRDEVCKDLALDGVTRLEVELEPSKLRCPFGDVAGSIGVMEDGPQWVGGHHHDLVGLKVMAELPGRNKV